MSSDLHGSALPYVVRSMQLANQLISCDSYYPYHAPPSRPASVTITVEFVVFSPYCHLSTHHCYTRLGRSTMIIAYIADRTGPLSASGAGGRRAIPARFEQASGRIQIGRMA